MGADDGMGVAYMLAILDDPSLKHPPLQCVFTTMEEIGLLGALNLKREYFHGTRYINLDEGGENCTCTTSSGGARTVMSRKLTWLANEDPTYVLQIRGLKGGHSAGRIHLELGNAILLAARVLEKLSRDHQIRIVDYNGGMKFNAIPREADIIFTTDADLELLKKEAQSCFDEIAAELQYSDAGFYGRIEKTDPADKALSVEETSQILEFLSVIPNGLLHHSMAIEGLSTASLNAGVIHIDNDTLYLDDLIRSAAKSHGDIIIHQLEILSPLFGFRFELSDRYLGWDYEKDSPMREILREALKEKGIEMKEVAIHGGLECGVFKGLIPELDIVTYGPISKDIHTPDERLDLASFDRAYDNLLRVLEKCI